MKVHELQDLLARRVSIHPRTAEYDVCVIVTRKGSIGGTPTTEVREAYGGIDWDSGKLLIKTEDDLQVIKTDETPTNEIDN